LTRNFTIIAYTSISVDGGIGFRDRRVLLSSANDLRRLHYLRSTSHAVVIGANTVLVDDPLLTVRLENYNGKQPYRVVVDKELRTNPSFKVYDTSIAPTILVTSTENYGKPVIKEFEKHGVSIVYAESRGEYLVLRDAFEKISDIYGVRVFLVEGGGFLLGSLIREGLIDKLIVSVTPSLLGLRKVSYINVDLEREVFLKLETVSVDAETGEVILEYKPLYEKQQF